MTEDIVKGPQLDPEISQAHSAIPQPKRISSPVSARRPFLERNLTLLTIILFLLLLGGLLAFRYGP